MIPRRWFEEYQEQLRHAEAQHERIRSLAAEADLDVATAQTIVLGPNEKLISASDIDALHAQTLTADDLAELGDARGRYQATDTRAFVLEQEERCVQFNCWMVRGADGAPTYRSEPAA